MLILAWLAACAIDTRELIELPVDVEPSAGTWDVDGVTISLAEASVTLADLRMEAPTDPVVWLPTLVPTAVAHPGHGAGGNTYGELLGVFTVDLLAASTALTSDDDGAAAVARLYEGAYATARHRVLRARLVGAAGATPFRFEVEPDREVTAVSFTATLDAAAPPSGLRLRVDVPTLLGWVDWSTPPGDDATLTVDDGAFGATVPFGVMSTEAWSLEALP